MTNRMRLRGLAAALALILAGCDDETTQAPATQGPPPNVTVVSVGYADVAAEYSFIGRAEATEQVELRARVEGFVLERLFEDGQDVEAGELLFLIEPEAFEAAVALAKANTERAKATLTEAETTLSRQAQLLERGNTSQAAYDEALAKQLGAAADVAAREAELQKAQIELGYTQIFSPLTGRLGDSEISPGELVGPQSDGLVVVTTLDPIHVTFQLSERDYVAISRRNLEEGRTTGQGDGVEISLRLPDGALHPEQGTIDFIGNVIDPTSGTVPVRLIVANPGILLLPGQFVTVELRSKNVQAQLVVPQSAVQQDQTGYFVLVVDAENKVQPRNVTLGTQRDTYWVVESGLEAGDLVIIEGLQKVRPGVTVETTLRSVATDPAGEPAPAE